MRHLLAVSLALALTACSTPSRCDRDGCEETPSCTADSECTGGRCVSGSCVAKSDRVLDVCFVPAGGTEKCAASGALELDFGDVAMATAATVTLELRSTGSAAVTLSAISAAGEGFSATLPSFPAAVAAGGKLTVPVTFAPQLASALEGHLVVESDDPTAARVDVHLNGRGTDGCALQANPAEITLGDVSVGLRATADVALRNTGTAPCTVVGAALPAGTTSALSVSAPSLPFALNPGDSRSITVAFAPASASDAGETTIHVQYGGPGAARELTIAVHAHAVVPQRCTLVATPGNAPSTEFLLSYGTRDVSSETLASIELRNAGGSTCALRNARIVSAIGVDASAYTIRGNFPASVAPGASTSVSVAFHPLTTGTFGAPPPAPRTMALFLDTDDVDSFPAGRCTMPGTATGPAGCAAWTLAGAAAAPTLTVSPSHLDLGQVMVGCHSGLRTITLTNVGAQSLSVTQLAVSPANPRFSATASSALPLTIGAGQKAEIQVRYAPTATGSEQATLSIVTNENSGPRSYDVALTGTGVTNASVRETFVQPASAKVDVLWIVDNSGSMQPEQDAIALNASRFIGSANAAAADYHIGIVTTDMEDPAQSGRLQAPFGKPSFITPGPGAAADFAAYVNVGTYGSSNEMGLEAMKTALSAPLANDATANAGFLRPDARLAVIVVSDEDDHYYENQSVPTTTTYANFLNGFKGTGRADETSFSAITGDPATSQNLAGGCSLDGSWLDAGTRYVEMQQATGGKFRSICSSDWGQIADDLASDIFSLPAYVNLSGTPDASKVNVLVNGSALPSGAWTYQVASNRVIFLNGNVPAAGSSITVDYQLLCP